MSKRNIKIFAYSMLLMAGTAFTISASAAEICFDVKTKALYTGKDIDSFGFKLSYSDFSAGMAQINGKACMLHKGETDLGVYSECYPVVGSAILDEGKIEIHINGSVNSKDYGNLITTYGDYQISLDPGTLLGDLYANVQSYIHGADATVKPLVLSDHHTGTVTTKACN
jgi:hypothetical protein